MPFQKPRSRTIGRRVSYPKDRRGAMIPLIALLLPVLIIFIGFSVDLAHMQNTRLEIRVATDSAARAAATKLSFSDSTGLALTEAKRIASLNRVNGKPLQLDDSDVIFGRSTKNSANQWVFTPGATPQNSVRIVGRRTTGSLGGAVPLYFGAFIGRTHFEPTQSATASFMNVDICLVLDRSTSMKVDVDSSERGLSINDPRFCQPPGSSTRWAALDVAVGVFIDELNDTNAAEHVALASYSSAFNSTRYCGTSFSAAVLDAPLGANLAMIDLAVAQLSTTVWNGNTDIESGMRIGFDELTTSPGVRNNAQKIMIVFTDGQENVGSSLIAAQECADADITIHTVTLGDYANQDRMRDVAAIGAGKHLHADDAEGLKAAFRELAAQVAQLTQ